jgi:hypothetical protein
VTVEYEEKILTELINRYERRDPAKSKKISFTLTAKLPEYQEPLSSAQSSIEEAVQHLLSWGFVACEKNLQGYYTRITLIEAAVPQIYDFLHRVPKADLVEAQRILLESTGSATMCVAHRFCAGMLERLNQRKELEYGLAKDLTLLKDVLLALEYLENLNEETYIRNFSEMVFHDSKRLQSILNPITRILMDYGDGVCQKETVLAQYNLISNPGYVYIKGDWQLWCGGQCVSVKLFQGGIALSSNGLDGIERIAVSGGTVISVENLTTYHDAKESQGAILYLGGFLNTVRANFLKRLYRYEPEARYFHKGDLDPYGFLILENLKEKTGIPFLPLEMDLDTLRRCHQAGHFRPLDNGDRKVMEQPVLAAYQPILQYMANHNCKIEQECFEAMKLEQSVGS